MVHKKVCTAVSMSGKATRRTVKTPSQISKALAYRAAGWSIGAISQKLSISPSTLLRAFKKYGAKKGVLSDQVIEQAKQELLNSSLVDEIKIQIASIINDDVYQVIALREAISLTIEQTMTDASLPAHYRARSLAALCTSVSLSQSVAHKALRINEQEPEQAQIPMLIISELTAEDIKVMQAAHDEMSVMATEITPSHHDEGIIFEHG